MVDKKTPDVIKLAPGEVYVEAPEPTPESGWQFFHVPTEHEVRTLLSTLPAVHGVAPIDYYDFVQPLPQSKKIKKRQERNGRVYMVDENVDTWTLYMSVAGRVAMLNAAAAANEWRVDFEPEPVTPTGVPGMLQMDNRIVYREYVVIYMQYNDDIDRQLGRRPGTAWVPSTGGKNAAGSNPFEKVETSARGRAIAAWGFGVFPGSGIASLEEMQGIADNSRAQQRQESEPDADGVEQMTTTEEMLTVAMQVQQALDLSDADHTEKIVSWLESVGIKRDAVLRPAPDGGVPIINWDAVRPGQQKMLTQALRKTLQNFRADQGIGQ